MTKLVLQSVGSSPKIETNPQKSLFMLALASYSFILFIVFLEAKAHHYIPHVADRGPNALLFFLGPSEKVISQENEF